MISRCLVPFAHKLSTLPKEEWAGAVKALPETCPHADCSPNVNCRALCADWARVQWRILNGKTSIPKTREARIEHLRTMMEAKP